MTGLTRLFAIVAPLAIVGPLAAHADFQMGVPTPQSALDAPSDAATIPVVPKFKIAKGYGNNVPLEFAARQIVPTTVRLRFGTGVDRDALVTWRGDAPWNHVLTNAVRPLGLRVVTGATAVTILR